MSISLRHFALLAVAALAACPPGTEPTVVPPTPPAAPAAPSNFVVEYVTSSRIDMRWVDNANNEEGYRIERCAGDNCTNFTPLPFLPANFTAAIDVGLTGSTMYRYRVQAYNAAGSSAFAGPVAATTLPAAAPPAAPSGFTATFVSLSRVDLAWIDNATNEDEYDLERCTSAGCTNFVKFAATAPNATSYTVHAPLSAGTSYTFRIYAVNGAGPSSKLTATITTPTGLASPGNFTATAASTTQINLSWTDLSSGEDGFRIERCQGSGCTNFAFLANAAANATSFFNGPVAPSTTYRYRVQAYNGTGSSAFAGPAAATTPAAATPPAPPSGLTATPVSSSRIDLNWIDNSPNEDGFIIERCSGAGCSNFSGLGTVGINGTSYSNTGLTASTSYSYRVQAVNTTGFSSFATATAVTPAAVTAPTLNVPTVSGSSITLTWSFTWPGGLASSADGYILEESTTSLTTGFTQVFSVASRTTPYTHTLTGRAAGTYYYRVRAVTTQGTTPNSTARSATVAAAATARITLVNQLSGVGSQVLRFRVATNATSLYDADNTAAERLSPDSYCGGLPGDAVDPGETRTFDVAANAPNYRVYIGLGRWDNSDGNLGTTCWFKKNWAADDNFNLLYIYNDIIVSNHSGTMTWTLTYAGPNQNIVLRTVSGDIPFAVSVNVDPIR